MTLDNCDVSNHQTHRESNRYASSYVVENQSSGGMGWGFSPVDLGG